MLTLITIRILRIFAMFLLQNLSWTIILNETTINIFSFKHLKLRSSGGWFFTNPLYLFLEMLIWRSFHTWLTSSWLSLFLFNYSTDVILAIIFHVEVNTFPKLYFLLVTNYGIHGGYHLTIDIFDLL